MILLVLLATAVVSVLVMLLVARRAPISSVDCRLSLVDHELAITREAQLAATGSR